MKAVVTVGDPHNEDRDLPNSMEFGDHGPFHARAEFYARDRFYGPGETVMRITVLCRGCGCSSSAQSSRRRTSRPGDSVFPEKSVLTVLRSAEANFRDRFPDSCPEAMVRHIMTS